MINSIRQIETTEKEIIGTHILEAGSVIADDNCARIATLINEYLLFVKNDESGWNALYRDPKDGRFWEKTYLQSEIHGGGPPSLKVVDLDRLRTIYGIPSSN